MTLSASISEPLLTVGRWHVIYLVPDGHPAPHELQRRLDDAVTKQLPEYFGSWVRIGLDPVDPSVWRIRDLAVNFSVDSNLASSGVLASIWSQQLAVRIERIIKNDESAESVLHFPNHAAFVAQFVSDLVAARAWGKWYYEEFEDLRVLSVSQAIRTVLLRYGDQTATIILRLAASHRLEPVLSALSESSAREIFDACFQPNSGAPSAADLDKWTGIILESWNEAPLRAGTPGENHAHDALRLFARTASRFPGAEENWALKLALESLLDLREVLCAIQSPADLGSALKAISAKNLETVAQAAAVLTNSQMQQRFLSTKTLPPGESVLSLFGGIFLLAPSLQGMDLAEMAAAAASRCESPETAAAVIRHYVSVKCLGETRGVDSADDPAVRLFSGFEGHSFQDAVAGMDSGSLSCACAHEVILRSLAGRERIDERCFSAELVSLPGAEFLLLHDLLHNEWLDLVAVPDDRSKLQGLFVTSLSKVSTVLGAWPKLLVLNDAFADEPGFSLPSGVSPRMAVLRPNDCTVGEEIAGELGVKRDRLLSSIAAGQQELSYFSLSGPWRQWNPHADLDCLCSLVARTALRNFARRLIGFELSSMEYLYQNFLSGLATIRSAVDRLEVRLPTSPLSLVLRIAGMQDQKFKLSWLKGREVWLLPPQE